MSIIKDILKGVKISTLVQKRDRTLIILGTAAYAHIERKEKKDIKSLTLVEKMMKRAKDDIDKIDQRITKINNLDSIWSIITSDNTVR